MKRINILLLLFISSGLLVSGQRDSFVKLEKLKSIVVKEEVKKNNLDKKIVKKNVIPSKRIAPFGFPVNQTSSNKIEDNVEKKAENQIDVLGIILSRSYKAVLINLNGDYIFLKEGERDEYSDLKVLKVTPEKVTIILNKKKKELEVENE